MKQQIINISDFEYLVELYDIETDIVSADVVYDNYYILATDEKEAQNKVQKAIDEMKAKKPSPLMYNIYSIDEVIKK